MFSYQIQQFIWIRLNVNNLLNILFCVLVSRLVADFDNVRNYNEIIYKILTGNYMQTNIKILYIQFYTRYFDLFNKLNVCYKV